VEQRELGGSGIAVSRVILGCGNFGGIGSAPAFFGQGESRDDAFAIMDAAWALGITTFDTADAYGGGRSETTIGEWLRSKGPEVRDNLVLTTKTFNPMDEGADRGLSRARILRQMEASLRRLGVDRVPLYMAHAWDEETPVEESLLAFDELVRMGKVGAVGASNVTGQQLAEALEISELEGIVRYEWAQNGYSLLERGAEEDVLPVCREHGLGFTPFSPLGGGWLTGKYRRGEDPPAGSRMTTRPEPYVDFVNDRVFDGLEELAAQARERGVSTAGLSLAWALSHPDVTAAVVGPRRPEHLDPVSEALDLQLSTSERDSLGALFP
jgi:aryl-alcohol dehydrogenase-like predicted oxidoreductase